MAYYLIALAVLAVIAALIPRARLRSSQWPVFARPVMTEVERVLYARLVQAFPERLVLPQVQISRFVEVRNVRERYTVFNRYSRLSADFVLCRPDTAVDVVIELDDASHARRSARDADARKDSVLAAAGIRIVRVHVRSLPSVQELRQLLTPLERVVA